MANELSTIRTLLAALESAFNTRNSPTTFAHAQVFDIEHDLRLEALVDQTMRGKRGDNPTVPGSGRGSTLSFKLHPNGLQTAGTGAVDGTGNSHVHSPIWDAAIGAGVGGTGTTVVGGTASVPTVTGNGNIAAGTVCGFEMADGTVEWRHVRSVAANGGDDDLTLSRALSAAPTPANNVYATVSFLDEYSGANAGPSNTLQCQIASHSADSDFEVYGLGCNSWSIERVAPGELAVASFDWLAASWDDDAGTIGALSPTTAALLRKSPWIESQVSLWPYDATTAAYSAAHNRALRTMQATHAVGAVPRPDPNSADGIAGWNFSGGGIAEIDITADITAEFRSDYAEGLPDGSGTQFYGALVTFGALAGRTFGVYYDRLALRQDSGVEADGDQMVASIHLAHAADSAETSPIVAFMG